MYFDLYNIQYYGLLSRHCVELLKTWKSMQFIIIHYLLITQEKYLLIINVTASCPKNLIMKAIKRRPSYSKSLRKQFMMVLVVGSNIII